MARAPVDDAYLEYYGFTQDPFAERVSGLRFFLARRKEVLEQLQRPSAQGLQIIVGPKGSGKTLLRQALVATSNKQSTQSLVINASQDTRPLLEQIGQILNGYPCTLELILTHVERHAQQGRVTYLMVDDAHQLKDSELISLQQLALGSQPSALRVFLFAESRLVTRLKSLIKDQSLYQVLELHPYDLAQTRAYLSQRLALAGGDLSCFTDEQIDYIHQASAGWPGAINQIAREELTEGLYDTPQASSNPPRRTLPWIHALALTILGITLAALFWVKEIPWIGSLTQSESQPTPEQQPELNPDAPIDINGNGQRLPLPQVAEGEPIVRDPLAAAAGGETEHALKTKSPATPKPVAPPASTTSSSKATSGVTNANQWYLTQSASHYTIQLVASRSEQNIQTLLQQGQQYRYFVKQQQGQKFYVLTYGSFSSQQAAQAAIRNLPAALRTDTPWVRSFSGIQQEIQQGR